MCSLYLYVNYYANLQGKENTNLSNRSYKTLKSQSSIVRIYIGIELLTSIKDGISSSCWCLDYPEQPVPGEICLLRNQVHSWALPHYPAWVFWRTVHNYLPPLHVWILFLSHSWYSCWSVPWKIQNHSLLLYGVTYWSCPQYYWLNSNHHEQLQAKWIFHFWRTFVGGSRGRWIKA